MRRIMLKIVVVGAALSVGGAALAADQLYVTGNSGTMYLLRNMEAGHWSLATPGSMSVSSLNVEQDTIGVVPGGFTLATVQTTPTALSAGGQVVLGTTNGHVLTYDANLSSLRTSNSLCMGCDSLPVQAVAVGQFGNLPVAVAAAHALDAPLGSGGFSVVTFNENMEFIGNTGYFDDGTGPDPDATALRFGNLDASRPGNELLITATNLNTIHKNSGVFAGVAKDPAASAVNPLAPQFIWDVADGNVSNGVDNPWYFMNNTIRDAYVANFIPDSFVPTGTDEIVVVGQTNDFTGPPGEGPHQFGTMIHEYYSISPNAPFFAFENAGAFSTQLEKPMLAVTGGKILNSDPNPTGFDFSGPNEMVMVGIDQIRICNGFTHCTQVINTNERLQQVILADVLHDDGVLEIVVATGNQPFFVSPGMDVTGVPFTGGRLLVFEHDTIGDMNTNFVLNPTGENPRGAIIELGAAFSVTGLAALAATTPPDGLPGDYNGDGFVDAADYTVWRNHLGDANETNISNNGDGGGIEQSDYAWWKANYGNGNPPGAGGLAAVPEPTSVALLLVSVSLCAFIRSRGHFGESVEFRG
jgi:hypothetical protein